MCVAGIKQYTDSLPVLALRRETQLGQVFLQLNREQLPLLKLLYLLGKARVLQIFIKTFDGFDDVESAVFKLVILAERPAKVEVIDR